MQRTPVSTLPLEWEIAYWRNAPYSHWEPIMQCPHSLVIVDMVQRLCEHQPQVHFRLRLCAAVPPLALLQLAQRISHLEMSVTDISFP
jgi:hypothetical protein